MSGHKLTMEAAQDQTLWDRCGCGGRAVIWPTSDWTYCAMCDECPEGTQWYATPSEVVQAWNRMQRGFKEVA